MTTRAVEDQLTIAIRAHGTLVVVALAGPLDTYTALRLRERIDPYAMAGERIVVDLSAVTLIDSRGLGALVRLRNMALREGSGQVGVVCPRPHLRRVFEITGLRAAFVFGPDLPAVRAALGTMRPR